MRAVVLREFGTPDSLRIEDIPEPTPTDNEVVIDVHAAAVNYVDLLVIAGKYQRKPPLPFAPGTECSGVVSEVGPGCERLKVGDEVVAVLDWGGLAEETVAHEVNVFPKPKTVGFVEAIQLAISYPTSAGSLTWPHVLRVPPCTDIKGPCRPRPRQQCLRSRRWFAPRCRCCCKHPVRATSSGVM